MDKPTLCQTLSFTIVGGLERFFYRYGRAIGTHPWRFILGSLLVAAAGALGALRFHHERNPLRLWVPRGSDFARDTDWLLSRLGEGYRPQAVLITAPDVLQPDVLFRLGEIHQQIVNVSHRGVTWEDVCFKVPIVEFNLRRRKRRADEEDSSFGINFDDDENLETHEDEEEFSTNYEFDPSVYFSKEVYCHIVNSLPLGCLENNLLDIWKYDLNLLRNLSKDEIVTALNTTTVSPVLGHPMDYLHLLGGVQKDSSGRVITASSLLSLFMVHINFSDIEMTETGNDAGTSDWATGPVLAWEKRFLDVMGNISANVDGMNIYYEAGRSYGDISAAAMFQDIDKLMVGILMMFIYVQIIVSKCNMVEIRLILGSIGLACVGMAFVVSCGLCSLVGISYGPVHTALPFLLMGIGVDDMFVVMAHWNNLSPAERQLSIAEQIGRTLKHAGSSITITSLTDVIAFLVGAFTILPSLQSFCLYAAVGVFITFLFQVTLFVACLALDQRRVESNHNGIVVCYKHKQYKANNCSQVDYSKKIFHGLYSKGIFSKPGKILIVMTTIGVGAISMKGNFHLKQEFDPVWFLPKESYLYSFIRERTEYYPDVGQDAGVYFGSLNYSAELGKIHNLIDEFKNETAILKDVEEWFTGFRHYLLHHYKIDIPSMTLTDQDFNFYISKYLFSPGGAKYQKNFRFDGHLKCGEPAPPIVISSFDFKFRLFHGPKEALPAMNRVKSLVKNANFSTGDKFATVWGKIFANWVTDEVIDTEVYRNMILACACVMLCTAVLIVNFATCFLIFICVLLTLMNVAGMMYYWGLTIDIVSCIGLELAAGLCVDYAAHVGVRFLTCSGSRQERALSAIVDIGPAIISGGISTLLALSVLVDSQSYIFISFFKIFLLVVLFGLFHGVVFLPVVLSCIGPAPYPLPKHLECETENQTTKEYELCNVEAKKATSSDEPS